MPAACHRPGRRTSGRPDVRTSGPAPASKTASRLRSAHAARPPGPDLRMFPVPGAVVALGGSGTVIVADAGDDAALSGVRDAKEFQLIGPPVQRPAGLAVGRRTGPEREVATGGDGEGAPRGGEAGGPEFRVLGVEDVPPQLAV